MGYDNEVPCAAPRALMLHSVRAVTTKFSFPPDLSRIFRYYIPSRLFSLTLSPLLRAAALLFLLLISFYFARRALVFPESEMRRGARARARFNLYDCAISIFLW